MSQSEIYNELKEELLSIRTDLVLNPGSVINDVFLVPTSFIINKNRILLEYRTYLQTLVGIQTLLADNDFITQVASVENETISQVQSDISGYVDEFGGNYGMTRIPSKTATGYVYFGRFDPPTFDILIPIGTQIKTLDEKYYETTEDATMTVAGNFYIPSLNQHAIKVPVSALSIGTNGNAVSGAISVFVSQISGIQFVENTDSISNGTDEETDDDFIARIQTKLAGNNFASPNGIKSLIKDNFPTVKDLVMIMSNNSLMIRDEGYGGKTDIYVLDETDPITVTDNYNAYDIMGPLNQSGFVLNKQPIAEDTSSNWLINGGLISDWNLIKDSDSVLSQSNFEKSFIYFNSTYTLPITAEYKYYNICEKIYNYLLSDDFFFINNITGAENPVDSSILIKKAKKRLLNMTFKMVVLSGYTFTLVKASVSTAINSYVNTLLLGKKIAQSDIVGVVEGVEGVDYVDFTGGVFALDSFTLNTLLIPLEIEYIRVGTLTINT